MIRRPVPAPLVLVALAVVAAIGCALLPGGPWVRIPFALPLAFALPGYAVAGALLPQIRRDGLRVAFLSLGLSLAIAVIVAVELGAAGHLNSASWAGVLAGVTALAAVIMSRRTTPQGATRQRIRGGRRLIGPCVLGACAVVVLGGAIALARTPLSVPDDRGYTVLSIAPAVGDKGRVVVAAQSEEAAARTFRLVIDAPGAPPVSSDLRLAPGERAEREILVAPGAVGVVHARLLDASDSPASVYRRVRLRLPAPGPAPAFGGYTG